MSPPAWSPRVDGATVRVAAITGMALTLAVSAGAIFDRFEPALLVAPAVTGLAALLTAHRRRVVWWPVVATGAAVGVIASVLLAGGSVDDVGRLGGGPRRLISTEWPSPHDAVMVGTLGALLAAGVVLATALASRSNAHLSPLLPVLAILVVIVALAAPRRAAWPLLLVIGLLTVVFVIAHPTGHRAPSGGNQGRAGPIGIDRTVLITLVAMAAGVVAVATTVDWFDRSDPRRTEDAEVSAALLDPIEATVGLRHAEPALAMFTVTDRSPVASTSLPDRWRLLALDTYDGQRWVPRVTLRPIGERLGDKPDGSEVLVVDAEVLTDDLDIVPFPGRPVSIDADVEVDIDRVVVRLADRPSPGTTIRLSSLVAPRSTQVGTVATRQIDEIAGTFTERASVLAGDGDVGEQLRAIEQTMRTEWQLDRGAPGGGQQLALIERFITDTQRGTREQFVTAYVLLVRSLGFDARVAAGFVVAPDARTSPLTLRSSDAAVWPEVSVDGVGWVAFDPVPESETTDAELPPPPPEAQSPAAAQPPIAPPAEAADDTQLDDPTTDAADGGWSTVARWLVRGGIAVSIGMLPVLLVVAGLLGWKWRRRRTRLNATHPAAIVRGAWANATDSLIDAGLSIAPAWTDDKIAEAASSVAPAMPHETRRLAAMATAMTFGPTDGASRLVDDAIVMSDAVDAAIRSGRSGWQRIRWRLSLRSIRPATRSPVRM